jgi:GDP-4-dehydro-6-deoxy-D-mannose reductase
VGRTVVEKLKAGGYEVWGTDIKGSIKNFPGSQYVPSDLQDERAVTLLLDEVKPDAIIHLAAQASARVSFDEPLRTVRNNLLPGLYILDFLRRKSLQTRLLVVGSAEEYGPLPAGEMPLQETLAAHPVNPYALSKTLQHLCSRSYAELYGMDVVITRSFNHTGPGQTDTFVLGSFARQIAEIEAGLKPAVIEVGNLEVKRDFLDVRDVADAYLALMEKGRPGEVYNVCSGTAFSLGDLLDQLVQISGVDIEIKVASERLRPVDTPELRGDHSKITTDTGWRPAIPTEHTLRSLLDSWRDKVKESQNEKIE